MGFIACLTASPPLPWSFRKIRGDLRPCPAIRRRSSSGQGEGQHALAVQKPAPDEMKNRGVLERDSRCLVELMCGIKDLPQELVERFEQTAIIYFAEIAILGGGNDEHRLPSRTR